MAQWRRWVYRCPLVGGCSAWISLAICQCRCDARQAIYLTKKKPGYVQWGNNKQMKCVYILNLYTRLQVARCTVSNGDNSSISQRSAPQRVLTMLSGERQVQRMRRKSIYYPTQSSIVRWVIRSSSSLKLCSLMRWSIENWANANFESM